MQVGVVDYEKQKNSHYSKNLHNALSYSADTTNWESGGGSKGNGFKQGDYVEVDVSRSTRTVEYKVNDKLEATQTH